MSRYRERIYTHYVESWDQCKVPQDLGDLEDRRSTMSYLIKRFLPKDRSISILDLGCGHGTLIHFCHLAGFVNAFGVDVSLQQVALAKKLEISDVRHGNLIDTLNSLQPSSLDVVVAFDVIEHLTKDELIELVDAVHRTLKIGGRWIIHAPNAYSPFFGAVRYGDFTHEQAFTPSSIKQLLLASGYMNVECEACGPRVHGFKSAIRVILWGLVCFFHRIALIAETGDYQRGAILTQNFYAVGYK